MIILDTPPTIILPSRPAIIRPAVDIEQYFPVEIDRKTRRAIVKELLNRGVLDDRSEARRKVEAAIPFGMFGKAKPALNLVLSAAQSGSVTNTTLALGGSTNAGDIIVVVCRNSGSSGTNGSISGYTKFYSAGNSSAATRFYFFYKIATAGETSVPTLSNSLAHRKMAAVYRPVNFTASTVTVTSMAIANGTNPLNTADPPAQTHTLTSGTFPKIAMAFYCEDSGVAVTTRTFNVNGADDADLDMNTGTTWFYAKFGHWDGSQATDLTVDMPDFGGNCLNSALLTIT